MSTIIGKDVIKIATGKLDLSYGAPPQNARGDITFINYPVSYNYRNVRILHHWRMTSNIEGRGQNTTPKFKLHMENTRTSTNH